MNRPHLDRFFVAVQEQTPGDTRFGDPGYLAAKFVVWQAGENSAADRSPLGPLAFTGVGIAIEDLDVSHVYRILCPATWNLDGGPTVEMVR